MAIILCPGCKEQVSDRATKCVHCGMVLLNECGSELEEGTAVCSNCGCPFDTVRNIRKYQRVGKKSDDNPMCGSLSAKGDTGVIFLFSWKVFWKITVNQSCLCGTTEATGKVVSYFICVGAGKGNYGGKIT